jgi:type II secretory pathway component GspD/PulD (secretin)
LNWLAFDVTNYSCANIAAMLAKFDVPIPQVRLKIKVYELTTENDDKIGIDFQNWKNNAGTDFFSIGGRYRNNWAATYSPGAVLPLKNYGSERTGFFNFNPRWNTRYIDLLASKGKANIVHSGEICIRNAYSGSFSRYTQLIYINTQDAVSSASNPAQGSTDFGVGAYQLLSDIVGRALRQDIPVAKGQQQKTTVSSANFGFSMKVNSVTVGTEETQFDITLSNTSLLGFQSNGSPRISSGNTISQVVSLPHGKDTFVIGGLVKHTMVDSTTGIPFLSDIPWIGKYLFGSTSKSIKQSQLVVVGQCINDTLSDKPELKKHSKPETKGKDYSLASSAN